MARGARRRRGARRARPRPASARARRRPRPADGCGAGAGRHHALHQHDPATTRARVPGRRGARAARALAHALERDRDGAQGEQGILRARRAHRELPVGGGPLRDRLQPLLERALRQPWRRPRLHAGPLVAGHLRSRVPRGAADRGAAGGLPTGGLAQRAAVVPASVADARLLAVPDRLDGARADHGHLPGPVHEVPRRARGRRHGAGARSGPSWATARPTSPSRWARSRWRAASGSTTSSSSSTATCSAWTARCAATGRSSRSSRRCSGARAGTSSRWCGARAGTSCWRATTTACCWRGWRRPSTATTRPTSRATAPTCASTSSGPARSCGRWWPT